VRALVFDREVVRYAAAAAAGRVAPGAGGRVGPLSLEEIDEPEAPAGGWVRVRPRLSGICGSDLSTIDGHASRYFEPIVSFPFVLGHEVVGDTDDDERVVLVPILTCVPRGITPACDACTRGAPNLCERTAFGHLEPGLQTGFCESTGGGWGVALVAHESQLVAVPDDITDEQAVLVEPTACAVHAARSIVDGGDIAIVGAGTLGLLTVAALRFTGRDTARVVVAAKHAEQRRLARDFGADVACEPGELPRRVRSMAGAWVVGDRLSTGTPHVVDCVGTETSLTQSLDVVAPGGTVHVVGMPGVTTLDLTGLWHREIALRGSYAYSHDDFAVALELVRALDASRLVSATYPLSRYREAIEHAANAGARGSVKIAFDLRGEKSRNR
jgi:threonine dehydrogenase-like Zn-dependent dehydrogenase